MLPINYYNSFTDVGDFFYNNLVTFFIFGCIIFPIEILFPNILASCTKNKHLVGDSLKLARSNLYRSYSNKVNNSSYDFVYNIISSIYTVIPLSYRSPKAISTYL